MSNRVVGIVDNARKTIHVRCDCGCCEVVFDRFAFDEDDVMYTVSVQDSYYDNNPNSVLGRLRRAVGILFGKPVCFNDACLTQQEFSDLVDLLGGLMEAD